MNRMFNNGAEIIEVRPVPVDPSLRSSGIFQHLNEKAIHNKYDALLKMHKDRGISRQLIKNEATKVLKEFEELGKKKSRILMEKKRIATQCRCLFC